MLDHTQQYAEEAAGREVNQMMMIHVGTSAWLCTYEKKNGNW